MIDRQARDRLYGFMVEFLQTGLLAPAALKDKLGTEDQAVHEIRSQLSDYVGHQTELRQILYRSPFALDWFFRCLVFLRTDLEYRWPPEELRSRTGCLKVAAPFVLLGLLTGLVLLRELWWLWLAAMIAAVAVYVFVGWRERRCVLKTGAEGEVAAWPFMARSELELAAVEHEGRLRQNVPGLFHLPR